MPKYIPTQEELCIIRDCPICGMDILDEKAETCSNLCQQQWDYFKEDFEQGFIKDIMKDLDDSLDLFP